MNWSDVLKVQVVNTKQGIKTSNRKLPVEDDEDCLKQLNGVAHRVENMALGARPYIKAQTGVELDLSDTQIYMGKIPNEVACEALKFLKEINKKVFGPVEFHEKKVHVGESQTWPTGHPWRVKVARGTRYILDQEVGTPEFVCSMYISYLPNGTNSEFYWIEWTIRLRRGPPSREVLREIIQLIDWTGDL
tara:strand:+ start:4903 stop:5472 length:570 start_codon:yes stop_codon:yes gene_type:complete